MIKKISQLPLPLLKNFAKNNPKCKGSENEATCTHIHLVRKKYKLKEYHTKLILRLLRFSNLFINIALIILNLLQIRFNVYPRETLFLYITIVSLFGLLTFFDAILTVFASRNKQTSLRDQIGILQKVTENKSQINDGALLIDKYYEFQKAAPKHERKSEAP